MDDMTWLMILIGILSGIILSLIFFGGLWYTLKHMENWRRQWILVAGSFIVRNAIVLAAFYFLILQHWSALVAAFIAFMITRQVVVRLTASPENQTTVKSHGI
ncbi:ATP synthase subunit I [Rhodohalobacter mucosus]|uniref:ATPase F0F1 n=1 Tax=Rhodohalobacter mucosus TaxID=2079485 RepID=A0A316TRQ3_9BACT|nr:ATP synthase subunit I [Rhodohalobacter mucosus]PWN05989.1 ATPase F0F1 [Rhodohalobacter mucosus]